MYFTEYDLCLYYAFNLLNNSKLDENGSLYMEFNPNKKPVEIIKEAAFGGTFKDIFSGVNEKYYRNSWKEFNELKNIDQKLSENSDLSKNYWNHIV